MDHSHPDRRKNNDLRTKIARLHGLMFSNTGARDVLDLTLEWILESMDGDYGLVAPVSISERNALVCEKSTCYQRLTHDDGKVTLKHSLIPDPGQWVTRYAKYYLGSGKPYYVTQELSENEQKYFPRELPEAHNAILIPLKSLNRYFAVIAIVNFKTPYTDPSLKRIWPVISSCGLVYRTQNTRLLNQPELQVPGATSEESDRLCMVCHDAIIRVDQKALICSFNPAAEKIFGVPRNEAMGRSIEEFLPSNELDVLPLHSFDMGPMPLPQQNQPMTSGRDATGKKIMLRYEIYTHDNNGERFTTYVLQNLTELWEIQRQQQETLSRLRAVTDLAPVGVLQTDGKWNCTFVNEHWCSLSGLAPEEVTGKGWINAIHYADIEVVISEIHTAMTNNNPYTSDIRFLNASGEVTIVRTRMQPLLDELGVFIGCLFTFIDVTLLRKTEAKLRNLAEQDDVTGLSNRSVFMEKLQNAIDRSSRRGPIGVIFIDLDGFKHINDTFGHDKGDGLLQAIAERLRRETRREDTVARFGADEFTLIMEALHDPRYASEWVNDILKAIAQPITIEDQVLYVSASAGIAIGDQYSEPKTLLRQAHTALYKAKAGHNHCQYFTEAMSAAAEERLRLHDELHGALDKQEFCIAYQPQIHLSNAKVVGTEALLRWRHPILDIRHPATFLKMLEESKLIKTVGTWILEQACEQHYQWIHAGLLDPEATISVNISAIQFYQSDLPGIVSQALEKSKLKPHHLVLEITESVVMKDMARCRTALLELKNMGVKVSLDDFGTGYASLSQLCELPIDQLKLDQSFIHNLFKDPKTATVSRSVLSLGRELQLDVIAEGIDSLEKLTFLQESGCQTGQGYYFSIPKFADTLETYLIDRKQLQNQSQALQNQ